MAKKGFVLLAAICLLLTACAHQNKPAEPSETTEASSTVPAEAQTEEVKSESRIELPPIPLTTASGSTKKADATQDATSPSTQNTTNAEAKTTTTSAKSSTTKASASSATSKVTTTTKAAATTTTKAAATTTKPTTTTTTTKAVATTTTTKPSATSSTTASATDSTTASSGSTGQTLPVIGSDEDQFEIQIN